MERPDGDLIQFYGQERIFSKRLDVFKVALDHRFVVSPDQAEEALCEALFEEIVWCANRRNEVAHSVVYDVSTFDLVRRHMMPGFGDQPHYVALPPPYAFRRHDGDGPTYTYAQPEMSALAVYAFEMQLELRRFRHRIHPGLWPTEVRA